MRNLAVLLTALLLVVSAMLLHIRRGGFETDPGEALRLYGDSPSKFLQIGGTRLHYRDEGEGPSLVLLHGSRASLHQWDEWVKVLRGRFRVIRYDALGHGLTQLEEETDYDLEREVLLLEHFVDALGLDTFVLGGTSSGSIGAVRFAAVHPERVEKLVLSTVPLRLPASMEMTVERRAVFWFHHNVLRTTATRWYWRHFLEGIYADPRKVTEELVERYYILNSLPGRREEQQRLIREWYAAGGPERDRRLAALVTAPVFIQWGAAGPVLPQELQCSVVEAFTSTTVRAISYADLGHKLVMEDAERTANDAASYLSGDAIGRVCSEGSRRVVEPPA